MGFCTDYLKQIVLGSFFSYTAERYKQGNNKLVRSLNSVSESSCLNPLFVATSGIQVPGIRKCYHVLLSKCFQIIVPSPSASVVVTLYLRLKFMVPFVVFYKRTIYCRWIK